MNSSCGSLSESCKRPCEEESVESTKKLCINNDSNITKKNHVKKKKMAVLLGYCGKKYYGMQINKSFPTVEIKLLEAMYNAQLITIKEMKEIYLLKFQRAARTDKGVSAARQVVSIHLISDYKIEDINGYLPPDIRVFSIKKVTKGFNSKNHCTARTYSYTLPSCVLSQEPFNNFIEKDYRITAYEIEKVNELLKLFLGTHNFHNFTSKKSADDPSAKRHIMSFTCGEPFIHEKEFITLKVKGQSFMLHQIRKMIAAVIYILRGLRNPNLIEEAFKKTKAFLPIAPGSGLILEEVHYDMYNLKYGNDGIHEALLWEDVNQEVENFRTKFILEAILKDELENETIIKWLKDMEKLEMEKAGNEKDTFDESCKKDEEIIRNETTDESTESKSSKIVFEHVS